MLTSLNLISASGNNDSIELNWYPISWKFLFTPFWMKSFILSSVVWLFSFWACPSPMPLFTTSETVVCCLSFTTRFPRLAGIWILGIRIGPVLEGILCAATTFWRVIVLEISILKMLPYSWIPEGRWGFESTWIRFFCIFLFQCSCFLI